MFFIIKEVKETLRFFTRNFASNMTVYNDLYDFDKMSI